jgi:hypothetical protein
MFSSCTHARNFLSENSKIRTVKIGQTKESKHSINICLQNRTPGHGNVIAAT